MFREEGSSKREDVIDRRLCCSMFVKRSEHKVILPQNDSKPKDKKGKTFSTGRESSFLLLGEQKSLSFGALRKYSKPFGAYLPARPLLNQSA